MKFHRGSIVVLSIALTGVALGGCSIQRAQEAAKAKASMVGMSKEQVLSCMGSPANAAKAGGVEVWSYNSGNGQRDTFGSASAYGGWGWASAFGTSTSTERYCKVDVVMNSGQVTRINYSGPTGGLLTAGEQCAFAVDNCARDAEAIRSASFSDPVPVPARAPTQPVASERAPSPLSAQETAKIKQLARDNGYGYQAASAPSTGE